MAGRHRQLLLWVAFLALLAAGAVWLLRPGARLLPPGRALASATVQLRGAGAPPLRISSPLQVEALAGALAQARPRPLGARPAGEPDLTICLHLAGQPSGGPCLRYWARENVLDDGRATYGAPTGFAELVRTLLRGVGPAAV